MLTTKNWRPALTWLVLFGLSLTVLTGCTPSGPRALMDGERLIKEGKYDQAIGRLQLATQLLPAHAQAWNHLGLAYQYSGQASAAIKAYEQARRCDPNLAVVRYNVGCLYLEQGNPAAAANELTAFTVLRRDSVEGWLQLGRAHLRTQQYDYAERSFQNVLHLRPNMPEALNALGVIQLHRRRPKDALSQFNLALQRQPNYAPALLNVAVLHHQHLSNRPLALQKYQDYLELDPRPADAAAVQDIIRQLQAELNPPRREPTNLVSTPAPIVPPPVPTTPAPAATNISLIARAATNATPGRAATNLPAATQPKPAEVVKNSVTNIPAPDLARTPEPIRSAPAGTNTQTRIVQEPPPTVEVVRLPEQPAPRVARDPDVGLPQGSGIEPAGSESVDKGIGQLDEASALLARQKVETTQSTPNGSRNRAVDRLNPTTWFRGREKPRRGPTPLVMAPSEQSPSDTAPLLSPDNSDNPGAPERTILARRYAYLNPPRPTPGDRRQAESFFARAVQSHRDGRLPEAVENYEQAVRFDPSFYEANYNLGLAAYELKNFGRSLSAYETALSINPTSDNARYNFAVALEKSGYFEDAASEMRRAIEQHPGQARAHFSLASLYAEKLSRPDLARSHYRKVLELEPQHPQSGAIRFWLAANP
jgi:tetratricopeptide (TPR) repeat protein